MGNRPQARVRGISVFGSRDPSGFLSELVPLQRRFKGRKHLIHLNGLAFDAFAMCPTHRQNRNGKAL
jgi:hypothetical protein